MESPEGRPRTPEELQSEGFTKDHGRKPELLEEMGYEVVTDVNGDRWLRERMDDAA